MKKISLVLTTLLILSQVASALAAGNPTVSFQVDCNTQDKQAKVGYVSDPQDPANGPEIIAIKFVFRLDPTGATSLADLQNAKIQLNSAYSNFVVAENKTETISNAVQIKVAGGFTGGSGLPQASDLLFLQNTNQKSYSLTVTSGEMYPKNSTNNIFVSNGQSFVANPDACSQTSTGTTGTGTTGTTGSTTGTGTTGGGTTAGTTSGGTTGTNSTTTSITLSSDKQVGKVGDKINVTALISNRNGQSIDWAQTSGPQIQPDIKNEEQADGKTKSTLAFTMPDGEVVLRVTVGGVTERISLKLEGATTNAAPTDTTATGSLQDRLRERREELASTAAPSTTTAPTNIHGAAAGLSKSGPGDTLLLGIISLLAVLGWRKLQRSESEA